MSTPFDRSKALDELDSPAWGEPPYDSYLVTTCHRLRKKPIGDFSVEDLRIMIGQGIGLRWLIPQALDLLEQKTLATGDFYEGDLLASVLRVNSAWWREEIEWRDRLQHILDGLSEIPEPLKDAAVAFSQGT